MTAYQTLRGHGVRSDKRLGQHILVDPQAIARIVDAAELVETDVVLEVGPGPGTLTLDLAQRAGQVVAVELDERMLAPLAERLAAQDNVRVVHGDILQQDIAGLMGEGRYKVVANLPYYVTSAVLRHVFESRVRPELLVVTVQREVAERIVGRPGRGKRPRKQKEGPRMSLLAVSVQFYGAPRIIARIPAGAFRPVPAVDSAVIRVDLYDPLPWGKVDVERFFAVARAGFAQSRKQLRNALIHNLGLPAERVSVGLEAANIDGRRRAETLTVQEWVGLSNAL
jgi:16S rRNA (adenine1518-N6/adenine1519-N6)-dimethyltransferase